MRTRSPNTNRSLPRPGSAAASFTPCRRRRSRQWCRTRTEDGATGNPPAGPNLDRSGGTAYSARGRSRLIGGVEAVAKADLTTIWDRIHVWLAANAPEVLASLRPGATDEAICAAEETMAV